MYRNGEAGIVVDLSRTKRQWGAAGGPQLRLTWNFIILFFAFCFFLLCEYSGCFWNGCCCCCCCCCCFNGDGCWERNSTSRVVHNDWGFWFIVFFQSVGSFWVILVTNFGRICQKISYRRNWLKIRIEQFWIEWAWWNLVEFFGHFGHQFWSDLSENFVS